VSGSRYCLSTSIGSAIADCIQENKQPQVLQRKFNIDKSYTLLSAEEEAATFLRSLGSWEAFYQMYPDSAASSNCQPSDAMPIGPWLSYTEDTIAEVCVPAEDSRSFKSGREGGSR